MIVIIVVRCFISWGLTFSLGEQSTPNTRPARRSRRPSGSSDYSEHFEASATDIPLINIHALESANQIKGVGFTLAQGSGELYPDEPNVSNVGSMFPVCDAGSKLSCNPGLVHVRQRRAVKACS